MDFIDLRAQQARIRTGVEKRLAKVLDHGRYILGPEIEELENKLAQAAGVAHCISCSSGTDALVMGLMALNLQPGDVVFVPTFTFVATAEAVSLLGGVPVFVDSEEETFNICPRALEKAIRETGKSAGRPAGIITVDIFGQLADYDEVQRIADAHGLWVMEDAAQSFGASCGRRRACSFGAVAATSFFPAKPLGCYGDGGAVFCNDSRLAEVLRSIRVHGQGEDKYDNVRLGINGRLDTLQAAVLLEKLTVFDDEIELRNQAASRYSAALGSAYSVPCVKPGKVSVWAQYCLRSPKREEALAALKSQSIPYAIYYPKPIHTQEAYRRYHNIRAPLPVAEQLAKTIFAVPMHPYLTVEDQDKVIAALLSV